MDRIINWVTKQYCKRIRRQLAQIMSSSLDLQKIEKEKIIQVLSRQFQKRINNWEHLDVTTYDHYQDDINLALNSHEGRFSKVPYFAKSAGTTSMTPRYIPTTVQYINNNHLYGSWITLSLIYAMRQGIDIMSKKNLLVGGAVYKTTDRYTIGDISGILIRRIPSIFHRYYVPQIKEATSPHWEVKMRTTALKASQRDDVVMFAGVPTWILTVAKEVLAISGKDHLSELWPHFQVYLHGGVHFDPYRSQFDALFPNKDILYLNIYNTSEGFFAVQDEEGRDDMLLLTANGVYYEFVPLEEYNTHKPTIIDLKYVELFTPYVLLISNICGLVRYVIGDTIHFTTISPFRIQILGRISEYINAFGEDLTQSQAQKALQVVLDRHNLSIRDYTVAPRYMTTSTLGCHEWYIEFASHPIDVSTIAKDLDQEISKLNFNYQQKRSNDLAIKTLEIISLPPGFYDAFAKKRKKYGAQNKLPKLQNNRKLVEEIMAFITESFINK